MKHQTSDQYAKRARRRFCKGTCFVAPVDLVLTGQRTLEEWAAILSEERDLEQSKHNLNQTSRALSHKTQL
jgi:hypothetical protein